MEGVTSTVRDWALSLVQGPQLDDKLRPPSAELRDDEEERGPALVLESPVRDASIALDGAERERGGSALDVPAAHESSGAVDVDEDRSRQDERRPPEAARPARAPGAARLPKMGELKEPQARIACLSRFAHHELCAVELFAWALLAFPSMPAALRRGFVQTIAEEQLHCRLYLDRLQAHGARFGELPLSDYFWKHTKAIASSANPPLAFLCAMGLTLEQANLDFTLMFRDGFRAAGDEATALVIQRVHDDEIGHVKLASTWLKKLEPAASDVEIYAAHAPFPFSLARAKGRRFDSSSRKRAALSDAMIEAVRAARPYTR